MSPSRFTHVTPASVLFGLWLTVGSASGQPAKLESLVAQSHTAMAEQRWDDALGFNRQAVERYGQQAPFRIYGAQFGAIYYHKGVCEMKLKLWEEAMRSFETCYRDFPNDSGSRTNPYQKLALLKWGESAMGAESWELAVNKFGKFIEERDRVHDGFAQGSFYLNLAICQYRLGRIQEGNENFEIALANHLDFPTPDAGILAGLQAMADAALVRREEQALVDFLGKNRGELTVDPVVMRDSAGTFLNLAGKYLAAGHLRGAICLYQFVPSECVDPLARESPDIVKLAAMAVVHEQAGNTRGALAAYRQLVRYFPGASAREEYFYHLVRTASRVASGDQAARYAAGFLREFPASPYAEEVREALAGEVDVAADWPPALAPQSESVGEAAPLPEAREFATALDLFQGRKYQDALAAFAELKSGAAETDGSDLFAFASYYEIECLRKMGDFDGLSRELKSQPKSPSLGANRLRQITISAFCDTIHAGRWEETSALASPFENQCLPGDQRSQIGHCEGLCAEKLGKPEAALNAYNTALTADAGASEVVTRQSALGILRVLLADSEVQADLAKPADDPAPICENTREAAAVARMFQLTFGAGAQLPAEFQAFLRLGD